MNYYADAHADTLLEIINGKIDFFKDRLPLYREGKLHLQVMAIYTLEFPPYKRFIGAMKMIEKAHEIERKSSGSVRIIKEARDMDYAKEGVNLLLSIEGLEAIEGNEEFIYSLERCGVRMLSLTWNYVNPFAYGTFSINLGITKKAEAVLRIMEERKLILDLAHISEAGFYNCLEKYEGRLLVSHANVYSLCPHPRNLKDEQLKALKEKEGIFCLSFCPEFIKESGKANIDDFIDHLARACEIMGVESVALGSDYDGTESLPEGLEGPHKLPKLEKRLTERGFSEREARLIMGENLLRFLKVSLNDRVSQEV